MSYTNQVFIKNFQFKSKSAAESATLLTDGDQCKIGKYWYYFVSEGIDFTVDGEEVLVTGIGGDTRWVKKREDIDDSTLSFSDYGSTGVLVDGGGSTIVNGPYSYAGEYQNRPMYIKDDNEYISIRMLNGQWNISNSQTYETYYEDNYGNTSFPRLASWSVAGDGTAPAPAVTEYIEIALKLGITGITNLINSGSVSLNTEIPVLASSSDTELVTRAYLDNAHYSKSHFFTVGTNTVVHNLGYISLDLIMFSADGTRMRLDYKIIDKNSIEIQSIPTEGIYRIQLTGSVIDVPESIFGTSSYNGSYGLVRKTLDLKVGALVDTGIYATNNSNVISYAKLHNEFVFINQDDGTNNVVSRINQITMALESSVVGAGRYTAFFDVDGDYAVAGNNNGMEIYDIATMTGHDYAYAAGPNVGYFRAGVLDVANDMSYSFGRDTVSKFNAGIATTWAKTNETRLDYSSSADLENGIAGDGDDYFGFFDDGTIQKFDLNRSSTNAVTEVGNTVSIGYNTVANLNIAYKDGKLYVCPNNGTMLVIDTASMTIEAAVDLRGTSTRCVAGDKFLYILHDNTSFDLYDYGTKKIIATIENVTRMSQGLLCSSNF